MFFSSAISALTVSICSCCRERTIRVIDVQRGSARRGVVDPAGTPARRIFITGGFGGPQRTRYLPFLTVFVLEIGTMIKIMKDNKNIT
jgi:hypothetical protein